jgi:non-canonical purine NTP pyrophosphatase (RdgB/HAM1 family)
MRIGRPGAIGSRKSEILSNYDRVYGAGQWRLIHDIGGRSASSAEALLLYEDAYFEHFRQHPDELRWIAENHADVYDNNPSNVESGLDYVKQEFGGNHYQDIAIRRCFVRNGTWFSGEGLLEIRMKGEGKRWSPAIVPFHRPDIVPQPELPGWWRPGSVESWYQSSKFLEAPEFPFRHAQAYFVTTNKGKVESARRSLGMDIEQVTLRIEEEQDDVSRIAEHKARVAHSVLCRPVICDDSGFSIEAMGGWPGHHVKRELERLGIHHFMDLAWTQDLRASFTQAVSYFDSTLPKPVTFVSETKGALVSWWGGEPKPFVKSDLAYCFVPEGSTKTIAQMSEEEYKAQASTNRWAELERFLRRTG